MNLFQPPALQPDDTLVIVSLSRIDIGCLTEIDSPGWCFEILETAVYEP